MRHIDGRRWWLAAALALVGACSHRRPASDEPAVATQRPATTAVVESPQDEVEGRRREKKDAPSPEKVARPSPDNAPPSPNPSRPKVARPAPTGPSREMNFDAEKERLEARIAGSPHGNT